MINYPVQSFKDNEGHIYLISKIGGKEVLLLAYLKTPYGYDFIKHSPKAFKGVILNKEIRNGSELVLKVDRKEDEVEMLGYL